MDPFRGPVAELPVIIDRGITWPFFYTVKDAGVVRNISGYIARTKFFSAPGGTLLYDAASHQVLGGALGTVSVKIPDEITGGASFAWAEGFFTHELETAAGEVVLRVFGKAITQRTGA